MVQLGATNIALFTDAGLVLNPTSQGNGDSVRLWGAGIELKNQVSIFGINFVHSVGFAQPAQDLLSENNQEMYYRIKTVLPF